MDLLLVDRSVSTLPCMVNLYCISALKLQRMMVTSRVFIADGDSGR